MADEAAGAEVAEIDEAQLGGAHQGLAQDAGGRGRVRGGALM
jgi:hypothetical protein